MNAKLSLLTFPQSWEGNALTVRALVMPRNFNPLLADQFALGTPAWADATMALQARLIGDGSVYPALGVAATSFAFAGIAMPPALRPIFGDIDLQFGGIPATAPANRLQDTLPNERARKYLPESYRDSFNFTKVRTPDAAIDDSYQCTLRDKKILAPGFKSHVDLSWGKAFAYCLRQPALAERVGFVYSATFDVDPLLVKDGSWINVDLAEGCSYWPNMLGDQQLVKRYAARLPRLKANVDRTLFAAVQFPVLIQTPPAVFDENIPVVPSNFDELLLETEQYDDGFCKIVHANQPVSSDLLREKEDNDLPVIADAGIRLAWDDEQLLIWMNRQIKHDEKLPPGKRTDAPMGVLQYRVDVRLASDEDPNPNPWMPLCKVANKANLVIGGETIDAAGKERELGVEVYPAKPDASPGQIFWLPQYYAQWTGKSLVLPDLDAIRIFKKDENGEPGKQAKKWDMYNAAGLEGTELLYGTKYEFRVRLADISGGGPSLAQERQYDAPSPEGYCHFRRYVQPQAVWLQTKLPEKDDEFFTGTSLVMKRPLLGYPSVLFTGAYDDPVADLVDDATAVLADTIADPANARPVGLADPNVTEVEVLVEVKALEMDMQLRYDPTSHESYARLYVTRRSFPADDFNSDCTIPLTFVDAPVLTFDPSSDLGDMGLVVGGDDIHDHTDIVLPTSRDIRITLRPVVEDKEGYYASGKDIHRKGKPVTILTRKASENEKGLFKEVADVNAIRGIWLQPDTDTYLKATLTEVFVENSSPVHTSKLMERLTDAIDRTIEVKSNGLSLLGKPGARLQFGASRLIRHNLSPDSTSITFSTKSDLLNQWIVPITLILNRDWTWDGAKPVSFQFFRQTKFVGAGKSPEEREAVDWETEEPVGDIEMKQAINIQALTGADRSQTYLCFLDAVEPKKGTGFPEEIMVRYRIQPNFKSEPDAAVVETDDLLPLELHLPMTGKPADLPQIVSAGIAQSKYVANETYSGTEPRRRFLWLEFDKPVLNPNDALFIRMLSYGPDPLLAEWQGDMLKAPEEAPLAIHPEPIRIIGPQHADDRSGLNTMQELTRADVSDVHYLVPLPPGLHAFSPELFGFFTYEIRVGHKKGWSTAQARFGRPLRTTGVQHPPPQLFCTVTRNAKHIMVTAPFAQTVFNGADVTSNPPRTQLWALLYAQVRRADGKAFRNILLDDQLFIRRRPRRDATGKLIVNINTDAVQYGITGWKNKDVEAMLDELGLPFDSSLSVLVVEMLPTYEKFFARTDFTRNADNIRVNRGTIGGDLLRLEEGMSVQHFGNSIHGLSQVAAARQQKLEAEVHARMEEGIINQAEKEERMKPLTDQLGSERILRTSTLVPVPDVCCTD